MKKVTNSSSHNLKTIPKTNTVEQGDTITRKFKRLIKSSERLLDYLCLDWGKEYSDKTLKKQDIQLNSTDTDLKVVFIELCNLSLGNFLKKPMCIQWKNC